jgi:hypothetical protein
VNPANAQFQDAKLLFQTCITFFFFGITTIQSLSWKKGNYQDVNNVKCSAHWRHSSQENTNSLQYVKTEQKETDASSVTFNASGLFDELSKYKTNQLRQSRISDT